MLIRNTHFLNSRKAIFQSLWYTNLTFAKQQMSESAMPPPPPPKPSGLESVKAERVKAGKGMLKKLQTKINKKTSELKQLIEQQESSINTLKEQIQAEHEQQNSNQQVYEQAMQDVQAIQQQIQDAEQRFNNIQQEMEDTKKDASESITALENELSALQEETATKHKTYEESIQFFFSTNTNVSPR